MQNRIPILVDRLHITYPYRIRRAKTTAQYVISKGIDASRITGSGKGETSPNVDCGGNCTEDEHQLNRRSEFFILEGNPNDE